MMAITTTGYYPSADGFRPGGPWVGKIRGGTTINAVLESKVEGVWGPEPGDAAAITGSWTETIQAGPDEWFRYAVAAVSGPWNESHEGMFATGGATVAAIASTTAAETSRTFYLASGAVIQIYALPELESGEIVIAQFTPNAGVDWINDTRSDQDGEIVTHLKTKGELRGPGAFRLYKTITATATAIYYDS